MTLRVHLTSVRIVTINTQTTTNAGEDVGKKRTLIDCWRECKVVQHYGKQYGGFSKKLKTELLYDLVTLLLGIYPKECAPGCDTATCTPMFTAALLTIAKL
jgi:hypothetical protein